MASPVFAGLDNTPTFTENNAAVQLDNNATLSDPDIGSGPYTGATLTLARVGGANSQDFFDTPLFDGDQGGVVVGATVVASLVHGDGTLVITFNSDATITDINQVLDSLTYANVSDAPPASVQVGYVFNDGGQATGSITVTVNGVNDAPGIAGATPAFYAPGSAGVVLSPGIAPSDVDSANLSGATVTLNIHPLTDSLSANVGSTGITQSYDSSTGVLTLSGLASVDTYRQVLASVTYTSSAADPAADGVTRIITWQVKDDGNLTSGTLNSNLGFDPVLDLDQAGAGTGFSTTFMENGSPVAIAANDLHITTADTAITFATVVLTNAMPGDSLAAPGSPLMPTIDTSVPGQITLTFTAGPATTTANFESALEHVVFDSPGSGVSTAPRDVAVSVRDSNNGSNVAHASISITAVNDAPVNTVPGAQSVAAHDTLAIAGLGASDIDGGNGIETTMLSVLHGTLTVAAMAGAAVSGSGSGTVTLNGTIAQINATLGSAGNVVYQGAADFIGADTLTIVTNDNGNQGSGGAKSDTDQVTINDTGTVLGGGGGNDSFTAQPGTERIDAGGGTDTISFNFKLTDATVTWLGNAVIVDGPGSHTILTGFEVYQFTDGTVHNDDADPLVDDLFYYSHYHDIWNAHLDADTDYHTNGWHAGRDPDAFFSTSTYLSANADVRAAGVDPLVHFDQNGWKEGRIPSINFDPQQYLAANPDVAAAHVDPLAHFLQSGAQEGRQPFAPHALFAADGFDYVFYLQHNPDVAAAGVDPFQHFETVGWREGRNPNALFDVNGYLNAYPDVAAAGVNPLDHYHQSGWHEGRDPSVNFDTKSYLAAYPDVAAAGVDPLLHYLQSGMAEGRSAFADGHFG